MFARRRCGWLERWLLVALVALLGLAAYASSNSHAARIDTRVKCKAPALAKEPKLPPRFPKPAEVTYTSAVQAGPSLIVQGYYAAKLVPALNEYKDRVREAGYTNLKTEHDPLDAEINYAGGGTTGQIALRDDCKEANTTFVRITVRPGATQPAPTTLPSWFVKLRAAAAGLVRETSFKDKDGSKRAFADLDKTFASVKSRLRVEAPDEAAAIDTWIERADASLKASNLGKAHIYAANIIKELTDAAAKLTAVAPAAAPKGLPAVFANLKATAHDLGQEAEFQDSAGIKRELAAFTKLFNAGRAAIKAKSPKAANLIATTLASVTDEVQAGDKTGIRREAKALVAAVTRAAQLTA